MPFIRGMCSVEILATVVVKEIPQPPQRVFSSVQPCVHLAPKVSTSINKPLARNGHFCETMTNLLNFYLASVPPPRLSLPQPAEYWGNRLV